MKLVEFMFKHACLPVVEQFKHRWQTICDFGRSRRFLDMSKTIRPAHFMLVARTFTPDQ